MNLQGARGILVNITAGMDLSLGEFAEVGDIVEEFSSDNATVVVGTVIDPDMTDELKVTVVATGLDAVEAAPAVEARVVAQPTASAPSAQPNYSNYDLPRSRRSQTESATQTRVVEPVAKTPAEAGSAAVGAKDIDLLDIPAFLRRQAN